MAVDAHRHLVETLANAAGSGRESAGAALAAATDAAIRSTGRGLDLSEADLSGADLRSADLRRATLNRTLLHATDLSGADLSEVTMVCPGAERTNFRNATLRSAYVHALALQTCTLDGADLRDLRDATGALLHGCTLRGAHLDRSQLGGSAFYQCDLTGASLRGANLQGVSFNECLLDRADLGHTSVDQLTVTKSSLQATSFAAARGADCTLQRLTGADGLVLEGASLPHLTIASASASGWRGAGLAAANADLCDVSVDGADLSHCDLSDVRILRCSLTGANLDGAVLNGATVRRSNLRGASLVAVMAENAHVVESDLGAVDATRLNARCLVARDVDMTGIVLVNANLYRGMLSGDPPGGMRMRDADLSGAVLVQAYLAADLTGANLLNVNAAYSRFSQSSLRGARLGAAAMYQSTWIKVDLRGADLRDVRAPVFVDRCPGLDEALDGNGDAVACEVSDLGAFTAQLAALLSSARKGST